MSAIFIGISNHSTPNLVNSVWTYKVTDKCFNTLKFYPKGRVQNYICELDYTMKGYYTMSKDTLIVTVIDDSHSEDGGKAVYSRNKYFVKQNSLFAIADAEFEKGKWKVTKTYRSNREDSGFRRTK